MVAPEPPPPPPPPPPPSGPARPGFDFVRPLAFVFEDPNWIPKVLLGGLFALAAVFLIGIFFIYGYLARLVRNVINGVEHPLPEWDDLGEFFAEGLRLFFVAFLYTMPFLVVAVGIGVTAGVFSHIGNMRSDALGDFTTGVAGCMTCILTPLGLLLALWLPGALLMTAVTGQFSAGFDFGRIWRFIRANLGNYLLAFVVWMIARMAAGIVGIILLCIGLLFTTFWSLAVGAYAFAQVYRTSSVK